jgi:SAM-dependent methyltransferase
MYGEDLAYIQGMGFGGLARGAAREIVRRLRGAGVEVRHVVDAGCGAGQLTAELTAAGFSVTGIDWSGELLAMARRAAPGARFVEGSVYEAELPACEGMVAVGEVLSYHAPEADAERLSAGFFGRAARALPAGGLLIFDLIETGEPRLDGRFRTSGEDWAVAAETEEDAGAGRLVRRIETFRRIGERYRRGRETHTVRVFEAEAVARLLGDAGFEVETGFAYGAEKLAPRRRAFFCVRR